MYLGAPIVGDSDVTPLVERDHCTSKTAQCEIRGGAQGIAKVQFTFRNTPQCTEKAEDKLTCLAPPAPTAAESTLECASVVAEAEFVAEDACTLLNTRKN